MYENATAVRSSGMATAMVQEPAPIAEIDKQAQVLAEQAVRLADIASGIAERLLGSIPRVATNEGDKRGPHTASFISTVAAAQGRTAEALSVIDAELNRISRALG